MTEGGDLLQTIAEVSVAFAGFASIVIAVRSRGPAGLAPEDRLRLQVMLGTSLATAAFSLFPFWLHHVGASPSAVWGISSGGIVVYLGVVIPIDSARGRRLMRQGQISRIGGAVAAGLGALAFLSQLANSTGLLWGRTFSGFLAGLLLLLCLSGYAFFRLVAVPSRDENGDR